MKSQGKATSPPRKGKKQKSSPLSPAIIKLVTKAFDASPSDIRRLASLPEDQLPSPRGLAEVGSWAVKALVNAACHFEGMKGGTTNQELKECCRKQEDELDEALGIMMRNTASVARLRAQRSLNSELLVWAIGDAISATKALPNLLEQFARIADPIEFSSDEPDTFPCRLVEALIDLVKYLEDQSERHPERFRLLARELPYWPFLVTPHRAGYRKRFERIVSFLSLGTECPLDTSPRAMYRLQTPVCGLLWEEIFRDWINVSAGVRTLRRVAKDCSQPMDVEKERKEIQSAVDQCCDNDAEREIFRAAFALPDLSKTTARDWANKFVIPYLHLKYANWQAVAALAKFIGKRGGDTQAEKEIRRAVEAMARS
jgi:hypothetical protein